MGLDVTIVGGGMIVHDQILPSIYHLQRSGVVGQIQIVATSSARIRDLVSPRFAEAFPDQSFTPHPDPARDPQERVGGLYKQVIGGMERHNLVVIATPDHLHHEMVMFALGHDQHVLCVKPLVQTIGHAAEIEKLARDRGLFVGVEYHKRFDRRALEARAHYRRGRFGEFRCAEAKLIEPFAYRHSNFQNWFTKQNADPFTYIGCHYVDQVYFITGLRPVEVAVRGIEGRFPNGRVGYLWSSGQVVFENGGILSCLNGLGYPDEGAGPNDQGFCMFCDSEGAGGTIKHDDQYRGVSHGYADRGGGPVFRFINPDYFRLVDWVGEGLRPVGYGYDSVEANLLAVNRIVDRTRDLDAAEALAVRRTMIEDIDRKGVIATVANSSINEAVTEAARASIAEAGHPYLVEYGPKSRVHRR